jgi:hypothetical protein
VTEFAVEHDDCAGRRVGEEPVGEHTGGVNVDCPLDVSASIFVRVSAIDDVQFRELGVVNTGKDVNKSIPRDLRNIARARQRGHEMPFLRWTVLVIRRARRALRARRIKLRDGNARW